MSTSKGEEQSMFLWKYLQAEMRSLFVWLHSKLIQMYGDEVVVTKFDLSAKEQTLKSRFLSNQRAPPLAKTSKPQPLPSDPQLDAFMKDMQESMRQQPVGALAGELLKKQANMMQQQIDLLRENQHSSQALLQNLSTQASQDPRRALAELLAPLSQQLKDMKAQYEDTKRNAQDISLQLQQLKLDVDTRHNLPEQTKVSVQSSMDKFALKKALFQQKVSEAQRLVDEVAVKDGGIASAADGVKYLKEQISQVQQDTEIVEKELQGRFQRIVEQCQRIKSLPQEVLYPVSDFETARERLIKRMGGPFDYDQFFADLNEMKDARNQLFLAFKQTAPMYPKIPTAAPVPSEIYPQPSKKTQNAGSQRQLKSVPIPQVQTKRTLTKKPANINDILTDPLRPPPAVSKGKVTKEKNPPVSPRSVPIIRETLKPVMVSQETQAEVFSAKETPLPQTPDLLTPDHERPPSPPGPEPFQLIDAPVPTKKIGPEDLMPSVYSPSILPSKQVSTSAAPRGNITKQTVDLVTEYVLANRLKAASRTQPKRQKGTGRWLGPDQLEALIKEGIFVDAETIDRLGKEVMDEAVSRVKMDLSQRREGKSDQSISEENEYRSDFEQEEIPEAADESKEEINIQASIPPETATPPKEEVVNLSLSFPSPPRPPTSVPEVKEASDISALLNPKMLSMMSASAVEQYISALIQAGHIGPRTEVVPSIPIIEEPRKLPEKRDEEERKLGPAPELEQILGAPMASALLQTLREHQETASQELVARFTRAFGPEKPIEDVSIQVSRPVIEESKAPEAGTEFRDAFSIPQRLNIDLEAEEAKLRQEQSLPRVQLKLPPFRVPEPVVDNTFNSSMSLSVTESSVGAHSVGSEIFSMENTEYMGSLAEYLRAAGSMEEGQMAMLPDLSEGEVQMSEEGLSTGEIPPDVLEAKSRADIPRTKVNVADILDSDEGLEGSSEGEFNPALFFKP